MQLIKATARSSNDDLIQENDAENANEFAFFSHFLALCRARRDLAVAGILFIPSNFPLQAAP